MSRIIIIIISCFVLFGCKKNENKLNEETITPKNEKQIQYFGNSSLVLEVKGNIDQGWVPKFSWTNEKNQVVNINDYKGRPIIINFWATWCAPCRNELPELIKIYNENSLKGLVVIGVSVDQEINISELSNFVSENQINYQIILDNGTLESAFGSISAIPTTFFVNKELKVVDKFVGGMDEETLKGLIKKIM